MGYDEALSREQKLVLAASNYNSSMCLAGVEKVSTEVKGQGYAILDSVFDLEWMKQSLPGVNQRLWNSCPTVFREVGVEEWFEKLYETFPGEEVLKDEKERLLWNPIVNSGIETEDKSERDAGRARYTGTVELLMNHFEKRRATAKFGYFRAALDVCLGWLAGMFDLDNRSKEQCWLPITGGRPLLTGRGCADQCGHNDFVVDQGKNPGYFFIVTGPEKASLHVCPGSHRYVFYHESRRRLLAEILEMEEIQIPKFSLFIGHGYLQHAGVGWRDPEGESGPGHRIRYHTYIVPSNHLLPDAIAFAYRWSFGQGAGLTPVDPKKIVGGDTGVAEEGSRNVDQGTDYIPSDDEIVDDTVIVGNIPEDE